MIQDMFEAETEAEVEVLEVEEELLEISPQLLVQQVFFLYTKISEQPSLHPCEAINTLFSELVGLCIRPCRIDVDALDTKLQEMRSHLILLCGQAEGYLERHYSAILGEFSQPLSHLHLFPYYSNYRKLAMLEYQLLCKTSTPMPCKRLAFVGSGPLPLTSIVLALHHMPSTKFDNYDLDVEANKLAKELVSPHSDLAHRMAFHTCNIKKVKEGLADYDVVFLAALVGMDRATKVDIIAHLAKYMKPGATLVVRSAHSGRAFLYPIVDDDMLEGLGFEVVSVFHPSDEVVNSIIITKLKARSSSEEDNDDEEDHDDDDDEYDDSDGNDNYHPKQNTAS